MLTTKEASALLGIQPQSVTKLIERGLLKAQRFGRDHMIDPAEVERYLAERRPAHRPKKHVAPPQSAAQASG